MAGLTGPLDLKFSRSMASATPAARGVSGLRVSPPTLVVKCATRVGHPLCWLGKISSRRRLGYPSPVGGPREILRPAGESAGLQDDALNHCASRFCSSLCSGLCRMLSLMSDAVENLTVPPLRFASAGMTSSLRASVGMTELGRAGGFPIRPVPTVVPKSCQAPWTGQFLPKH